MNHAAPFRLRPDGILLMVRLTPRASRDGIDGLKSGADGTYVRARVRAVPEDGRANAALAQLVADQLRVPKSTVTIASGNTARLKTLHIAGHASELEMRLTAWLKEIA